MKPRRSVRLLVYSHDSFGMGHLRRSLAVASALVERYAEASVLCLTGSPLPDLFDVPARCDIVKIPCIGKRADGRYVSRHLPLSLEDVVSMRAQILTTTVRAFRPDLLLVDHTAAGPGDELIGVLRRIHNEGLRTRTVLGIRDIIDAPLRVRVQMQQQRTIDLMRSCYDALLVYGDRQILDVSAEYGLPEDVSARARYVGLVTPPPPAAVPAARDGADLRLLVSAGGGEDGYVLLRGIIAALRGPMREAPVSATLVTGPLMPDDDAAALLRARQADPRIELLRATRSMADRIAGADLVVAMGGYNSVYEVLRARQRLLVVPREAPRQEQRERAVRLARLGLLTMLREAEACEPALMAAAIRVAAGRERPDAVAAGLSFDGAARAADELMVLSSAGRHGEREAAGR